MRKFLSMAIFLAAWPARGGVVDRVAVIVGNQVITASEVEEEVRVTEFENQEPLDLAAAKRREAAERLIDQLLIRNEIELEGVQEPPAGEGDELLEKFRRSRFASQAQLDAALGKYGITRDELKQHLLWQATAVRFVDFRFRVPGALAVPAPQSQGPGTSPPAASSDDLETWLKDARSQVHIEFKQEAFQ
jgi:hypothetical protein